MSQHVAFLVKLQGNFWFIFSISRTTERNVNEKQFLLFYNTVHNCLFSGI